MAHVPPFPSSPIPRTFSRVPEGPGWRIRASADPKKVVSGRLTVISALATGTRAAVGTKKMPGV